ncbi:MAG: hypothetical protein AB8B64_01290 [Granulosicoccus sp.]
MLVSIVSGLEPIVLLKTSEELLVRKQQSVNVFQVIPLVLAALLVTIGLAMYLSDTSNIIDAVRSIIVVFGGAIAGLLISFSVQQIHQALQLALSRGIQGGNSPRQMIRAMLKVCEVSRRDGLLGVAEIRSNSSEVEEVCQLIGDASNDSSIRFALDRRIAGERVYHQMAADVFLFTAIYSLLFGLLGTIFRYVNTSAGAISGSTFLPFISGASLAIILTVLLARLRAAHMREVVIAEIAYRGAVIMLEDNNVQRLHARLSMLVPPGLRS